MKTKKCPRCKQTKPSFDFQNLNGQCTQACTKCLKKASDYRKSKNQAPVVYVLVDPRDSRIFYVGCTRMPKVRLAQHLRDAHNPNITNPEKKKQIREIQSCGLTPIFVPLEITTLQQQEFAEKYWIKRLALAGAPLTNFIPKSLIPPTD